MDQAGGRGQGRRRRGRGRGRGGQGPPVHVPNPAVPVPAQVADAAPPELNLDVPENLLNQSQEIDQANQLLSQLYYDMRDLRTVITTERDLNVHDTDSQQKVIDEYVKEYKDLRSRGEDLRDSIRKMEPTGVPFEEPHGFDIIP